MVQRWDYCPVNLRYLVRHAVCCWAVLLHNEPKIHNTMGLAFDSFYKVDL